MFAEIKKQFRICRTDMLFVYLAVLILALLGFGFGAAMYFSNPAKNSYIPLGTILSGTIGALLLLIMSVLQYTIHFNLAVSMGIPRRVFIRAHILNALALHLLALLVWMAAGCLEVFVWNLVVPEPELAGEIREIIQLMMKYGVPVIVFEVIIGNLCAALWNRFGKIAGGSLWILWMALCISGPHILNARTEAPDSFWGKAGAFVTEFFSSASKYELILGGAVLLVLALGGIYACIRRQEVRG